MMDPDEAARIEERLTQLEAVALIQHGHVENLIERVYELENEVAAVKLRLGTVERATPWKKPKQPPPKRPMR
jgi:hypothetical protein